MAGNVKGKAKIRYIVACQVHGRESDAWAGKQVVVQRPQHKRQRLGGCPVCKAEQRTSEAA